MSARERKRQQQGPFAGIYQPAAQLPGDGLSLVLAGTAVAVTADSDAHAAVEQALVPHPQDADLLLDRFDARLLLDSLRGFDTAASWEPRQPEHWDAASLEPGVTAAELQAERYADLDPAREHLLLSEPYYRGVDGGFAHSSRHEEDAQPRSPDSSSGPAQHQGPAFAFDYGSASGASQQQNHSSGSQYKPPPLLPLDAPSSAAAAAAAGHEAGEAAPRYEPPFEAIPEDLRWHLPSSERAHQIISQTAQFVRSNGGQVELLLRVKHGANPNFAFLRPDDRLFPYYRWLVEQAPQELPREATPGRPAPDTAAAAEQQQQQQQPEPGEPAEQPSPTQQAEAVAGGSSPAAAAAAEPGDLGGLELLRAYSMATADGAAGGVAAPPAQVKAIVDKLVAFVRKNGIQFERVVRLREASNPRFAFMHPWSPHHAYYMQQLERAMGAQQRWEESMQCLFMRERCTVEVLRVEPQAGHLLLKLADGYNTILVATEVASQPGQPHHSMVTQSVECFASVGGALLPSERLARMFEKHDGKLARLQAYLQPCPAPGVPLRGMAAGAAYAVAV
ncbi:hypothetical protein OEZ86_000099 [Tetradesmus obliquus]|nr:hypothetical protein OEZ86_000099 [Tetradesmus obliquus]